MDMISIIVPIYNCEQKIERCIQSIRKQTIQEWELLLIDDGSSDSSRIICDKFAKLDKRIHSYHKLNGGVSSARNFGMSKACGEYILFCDSDDVVEPEWCATLKDACEQNSTRLPICNYYRMKDETCSVNNIGSCDELPEYIDAKDFFMLYMKELLGIPWNKIYRRSIIEREKLSFKEGLSLGEDLIFVLQYMDFVADGFYFIKDPLYRYDLGNEGSLSKKYYQNLYNIYTEIFKELGVRLRKFENSFESYEKDYYHSYFYAMDRVFRNTWNSKMCCTEKWNYNSKIYRSESFCKCKKVIRRNEINILQYYGLKSRVFSIYWCMVWISENISRILHRKYRGKEK